MTRGVRCIYRQGKRNKTPDCRNKMNTRVLDIEKKAEELMSIDTTIWDKFGFQSGRDVEKNKEQYQEEVKKQITEKVHQEVVDELEDNNCHSMVEALHDLKLIQK